MTDLMLMARDIILFLMGAFALCCIPASIVLLIIKSLYSHIFTSYKDMIHAVGEELREYKQTPEAQGESKELTEKEINKILIKKFMK